jgi:hypothetical protein
MIEVIGGKIAAARYLFYDWKDGNRFTPDFIKKIT